MIEVKLGLKTVDLPYQVRVYDVSEDMFDEMIEPDTRAELIDGVMIVHSPATIAHDDIGGFVRALLRLYTDELKLGRVLGPDSLVHLATCRRFCPDAYFTTRERMHLLRRKQFEGAPDLVIEVLSSSNKSDDLEDKRPAYRAAGVKEIWFIDPDEQVVIVDRRRGKSYTEKTVTTGKLASAVAPGFWVDVSWLWQEPLPNTMQCLREILGT